MRKYCKFLVIAIVLSASSSLDAQSRDERMGASNTRHFPVQPQHRGRQAHSRVGYRWGVPGFRWGVPGYRWSGSGYGWGGYPQKPPYLPGLARVSVTSISA